MNVSGAVRASVGGRVLHGVVGVMVAAGLLISPGVGLAEAGPAEDCQAVRDRDHQIWQQLVDSLPPGAPIPPEPVNPCITEDPSRMPGAESGTSVELPDSSASSSEGKSLAGTNAPSRIEKGSVDIVPLPPVDIVPLPQMSIDEGTRQVDVASRIVPAEKEYPVNEIMAEWDDACGNPVVLRRGYYDTGRERGFGWDKVYHRHNIAQQFVIADVVSSSCGEEEDTGTARKYFKSYYMKDCAWLTPQKLICEDVEPPVRVKVVVESSAVDGEGRPLTPDGKQKGVITAFCLTGELRCPDWVSTRNKVGIVGGVPIGRDGQTTGVQWA